MTDVLGVLQAPGGETVKVVVADARSIGDERVVAFPTLTDNIIVAVNRDLLIAAIERVWTGDDGEPSDDDVNVAMMQFVPEIVVAASDVINDTAPTDPFDLHEEK
jgi:hypothetical protein